MNRISAIIVSVAFPLVLISFVAGSPAAAANAGAPSQPAARSNAPASRPAPVVDAYPPAALAAECEREAAALRAKLDDSFTVIVAAPFIVAGNMSEKQLRQYAADSALRPAKAMWAAYFRKKPDKTITVMLFAGDKVYRDWARKLYGDADVSHFGYYKPDLRTLVMNIETGSGTLVHELTHALIVYDFPDVPQWFNEGLASLHEQCTVGEDDITGWENWRLPALQQAIAKKQLRPLGETVTQNDFYGRLLGLNYAQARYFCLYMQRQGVLKKFYAYYRDHHEGERPGAAAIEHVFNRKIADIDADYVAWVKTLKAP